MSIKKQIRKIGGSVTVAYNSSEKYFTVSTESKSVNNPSLKRALKDLKKELNPEKKIAKITPKGHKNVS